MDRSYLALVPLVVMLLSIGAAGAAPLVTLQLPANQELANSTSVTFTATTIAPAGLASATLLVGGPPLTTVFSGAAQLIDTELNASTPATPAGGGTSINIDGQNPHAHGLLAVPGLIGAASGQVPAGAVIASAVLRVNCTNPGNAMALFRLTEDWVENEATWNERQSGTPWTSPGAEGAGSHASGALPGTCGATGQQFIDITPFVQQWSDGAPNYGIVFTDTGTDGIDFDSSESGNSPVLTVVYQTDQSVLGTQILAGTTAAISIQATLPEGSHYWNVEVADVNGERGRAAADFELTVDTSYPDAPVLLTPAADATGASPGLPVAAWVSDPAGGPLTARLFVRQAPAAGFTIIALPDTQHYSEAYPAVFTSQTTWIVNNKVARNIAFVTHEGDIVQNAGVVAEWQRADTSLSLLDGVVPYGMGPGNHDQPTTLYNQYFPWTRYAPETWYGGHYQNLNDNNYQLFSAGGLDFVIVHLEFCPPAGAVTWADGVLKSYPQRIGMMTTHGYLDGNAQRTVSSCASTQYLWDGLAVPNPNLHFILSGHVHSESRRTDTLHGHPVHQMLSDYQDRPSGGEGWLRILRFEPAEDKVHVQTYSPWLDQYETDANSRFSLDFVMGQPFGNAGSAAVTSGSLAVISPAGLLPFTEYEWQMTVSNAAGKSRASPVLRFTTGADLPPADTDGDGVADAIDNCTDVANADQLDADADGYGNICDADLNNSGTVTVADYGLLRSVLGQSAAASPLAAAADLNGSGAVTTADYGLLRARLGTLPGPSALAP